MINDKWIVYRHIFPNGKSYIGITNCIKPNQRWVNGLGYRTQKVMFRAILKYGWDNIEHQILYSGLNLNEAKKTEERLIKKFKTNISEYGKKANGYNMTSGGDNVSWEFFYSESDYVEKMENNVWSKSRKPVDMYDTNGNYLKTFESVTSASKFIGVDKTSISLVARGKANNAGGYRFAFKGEPLKPLLKKKYKCGVAQYTIDGKFLTAYDSLSEASRFVMGNKNGASTIGKCCKNIRDTAYGYIWKYKNN